MSTLVGPLYKLLKKNVKWEWKEIHDDCFQKIKNALISADVLIQFDPDKEIILTCDSSSYGVSAVLSHRLDNGLERPIGFASRVLNNSEKGYSQIDKEALAIVFGIKYFHQYLYMNHFILRTDH